MTRLAAQTPLQFAQQAYLKASNTEARDLFGYSVAVSGDTVVVAAYGEASNTGPDDAFGISVALSGTTVMIGTWVEDSNATGVNGNQSNNSALDSGAAYVFSITSAVPALRLATTRSGDMLQLTATGTTNTQWRLESRDTVSGTNVWEPLTNITLGPGPTVIQQPFTSTNRFYRGALMP
jgi:hypothetical protein